MTTPHKTPYISDTHNEARISMATIPNNSVILESISDPSLGCISRVTARYCGSTIDRIDCMPGDEPRAVGVIIRRHFFGLLTPGGSYDSRLLYLNSEAADAYANHLSSRNE